MTLRSLHLFLACAFAACGLLAAAETTAPVAATDPIAPLLVKPLYQFTEAETGLYLAHLQATEPDLRRRIVHLARKNIGQPYEIYLLGEMPFETYDPQPIYCLGKSDCLVFTEHIYAMALTRDWTGFIRLLQRIRYRDGHLGVASRNHYTELDWNHSNRWLVRDLTTELAGAKAVPYEEKIDRAKFLLGRYGLKTFAPIELFRDTYIPLDALAAALPHLRDGDFVNVVRASISPGSHPNAEIYGGNAWVGHTGLIAHGPDGTVHLIHSAEPAVREEPIAEFIARSREKAAAPGAKQRLVGFKFLRLSDDPLAQLRQLDGPDAPRVTLPNGAGF
ncbi:MAG: N-acetylmuramoyl-L-alanine amidase-like domain-containing protein [Opitutaceae bacterium]